MLLANRLMSKGMAAGSGPTVEDYFTEPSPISLTSHTPDTDVVGGGWSLFNTSSPPYTPLDPTCNVSESGFTNKMTMDGNGGSTCFGGAVIDSGIDTPVIAVDIKHPSTLYDSGYGLVVRYVDASNYYYIDWHATGTVRAFKIVSGVITALETASLSLSVGTTYPWQITMGASSGVLNIGGTDRLTFTANVVALNSATSHGVGTRNGNFSNRHVNLVYDNFVIQAA